MPDSEPDTSCAPDKGDQPASTSTEVLYVPCGGNPDFVESYPAGEPMYVVASDDGACPELAEEAGFMHVYDATTMVVNTSIPWPEINNGGGEWEFGPGGSGGTVLALSRSEGRNLYNAIELFDPESGERLGSIQGARRDISANISFAGENLLTAEMSGDDERGVVYLLKPPWTEGMDIDDAPVVHHNPDAGCGDCGFGGVLDTLGDVTGDGIDDAVMGGEGLWFVDGLLLLLDDGVQYGVEVDAPAVGLDRTIENVGDFDGDGIDDYASLGRSSEYGINGIAALLAGGAATPFARVYGPPDWGPVSIEESVGGLGDLDGDGDPTMVLLGEVEGENSQLWLVEGPLRCGDHRTDDVGTKLAPDGEFLGISWFAASKGFMVMPVADVTTDEDLNFLMVKRWE